MSVAGSTVDQMPHSTAEARRLYHREYQRRVQGKGWDLDEVLAHIDALAESGVSLWRVSEVSGLDYSGLVRLRRRGTRISRRSALAILAVQPEDAAPSGTVPIERLEALLVRLEEKGWTRHQVATALGWANCPQTDRPGRRSVRLATLWQVESLVDQPPRARGVVLDGAAIEAARTRDAARRDQEAARRRDYRQRQGVARMPVDRDDHWKDRARCRDMPKGVFYESMTEDRARAVCAECDVQADCLAYALSLRAADDQWGVFGGTTAEERLEMRKARRRAG